MQLGYLERLGLLVDRRRRIGQELVTKICQLHQLVLELVAGGAKKDLPAAQAGKILAGVRPKDDVGKLGKGSRSSWWSTLSSSMCARGRPPRNSSHC